MPHDVTLPVTWDEAKAVAALVVVFFSRYGRDPYPSEWPLLVATARTIAAESPTPSLH